MSSLNEIDPKRRQLLLYLLSTGTLAALAGCASGGPVESRPRVEPLPAGKSMQQYRGDVTVNGQPVSLDTLIVPGDLVETGDKSYAIFVVEKDAFILHANSRLLLPIGGATPGAFQLDQGKLLSVLATRSTRITTPSAVIRIRGTGIYLEADADRSYVCTCYGETDLATADDPGISETVISTHHDAPRYILADRSKSARIVPAPFKNHDDQELLLIETLVGRTTPYVVPGGPLRSRRTYY